MRYAESTEFTDDRGDVIYRLLCPPPKPWHQFATPETGSSLKNSQ